VRTFAGGVILRTAGERSVTATDLVSASITGTQAAITVEPADAATLDVAGIADPVIAGVASGVTVTARDAFGNVATGYTGTVQFTSSDPRATVPADYTFVSGDAGVRAFPGGVTLESAGEQSVTATDGAEGSVIGTQGAITVQPADPATLTFSVQPTNVTAGDLISPAPQVTAFDAFDNVATTYSGTITLSLAEGTGTSGAVLSGDLAEDAVGGVATFGTLSVDLTGTGYRLAATDAGLPPVNSDPFDVSPGAANHLAFTGQPVTTTAGEVMATVEVSVLDAQNNLVTDAATPITLAIAQGPPGATLFGDVFVEPDSGVATFTDLRIERTAANYRLSAGASGTTSALSNLFAITAAAPATMTVVQGAGQTGVAGQVVAVDPAVRVTDAYGNNVPSVSVTFTPSGDGGVEGSPAATGSNGVATVTSWTLGSVAAPNSDTLTASAAGVASVRFVATATAGAGATLQALSSTALAGITGTPASPSPTVVVEDAFGNPVAGVSVTFTPGTGSGSVGSGSVTTGADGQASTTWTYGLTAGGQTLDASVDGLAGSPVRFSADVSFPTVTLGVDQTSLAEDGSDGPAVVTATLSAVSGQSVTVDLGFNGTAINLRDYEPSATSIVIPAGSLSGAINLTALADALDEADETIIVDITSVAGGTEGGVQQVTVTIVDDDATPTVAFALETRSVGENANAVNTTVQLSAVSGRTVTVPFSVGGAATGGVDYTATSASPLIFAPGTLIETIHLNAVNDVADEPDETVIFTLGTPTNATLGTPATHTLTITDNDMPPTVTLGTSTAVLPETGGEAIITATLSAVSGFDVTVDLGFTGTATGGGVDYSLSGTSILVPAGSLTGSVTLTAAGDLLDEPNETVIVDVAGVTNGTESGTQQLSLSITDDDDPPVVQFATAAQANLESVGTVRAIVELSAPSGLEVTVPFTVTGSAVNPDDYTITTGPAVIPAGSTADTIVITVAPDALDEDDETVVLTLDTPTNATLGGTTVHTATIQDDDATPTVQFTADAQSNLESVSPVTATVQLSAASGLPVTVPFTVTGTATGADRSVSASPVVFAAGFTIIEFMIAMTLSPSNASSARWRGTAPIVSVASEKAFSNRATVSPGPSVAA